MRCTSGTLVGFFVSILLAASGFSAEPGRARGNRAVWGTVAKATAESVTVAPESVGRSKEKPAEQTFALSADDTEFMFAEVGMQGLMANGSVLRTLNDPQPASASDLKAGQLVEVTAGEKSAKRIVIAWSAAGTIVEVNADSITFRPAHNEAADNAPPKDGAKAAAEQTLAISEEGTTVRIATVTDERPAPGRGVVRSITYRRGALSDLKADQSVVICIRNETAVKITIHPASVKE